MRIAFSIGSVASFVMGILFIRFPREAWNLVICSDFFPETSLDNVGFLGRLMKKINDSSYPLWHMRVVGCIAIAFSVTFLYLVISRRV